MLLDQVRAEVIAAGYIAFSAPDFFMETLIDALNLPNNVIIIETRME